MCRLVPLFLFATLSAGPAARVPAQGTRLLRQPTLSATSVAFVYGGDLWVVGRDGGDARRLTSTPAVESDPHFSPDGKWIAFTSTQSGTPAVYVMPAAGGAPRRLSWHPAASFARGWSPDGSLVLYSSQRGAAPVPHARLWTVPVGGGPSRMLPAPMGLRGSFASDGRRLAIDRVDRWDVEWRNYRGGQNTAITILDLADTTEVRLPNDQRTADTQPVWLGETIFFLSDRDYATNVWAYETRTRQLRQVTHVIDADVKSLAGAGNALVVEQDGWLHLVDPSSGQLRKLDVTVRGDFPWAMPHWKDVSHEIATASLGPAGRRALFEARGEIFTVPVEKGDARNLTHSSGTADHAPVWSPDGRSIAWFSDSGAGYTLQIAPQDGLAAPRTLSIGESKMAWEPSWSPDGSRIAFVDDRTRLQVIDVATGKITTADADGGTVDRTAMAPHWSPDSRWIAYSKLFPNQFRRIVVWSAADGTARPLTDPLANAVRPSWDRNRRWLYFLASTDLGLSSAWANVSSLTRRPSYSAYVLLLSANDTTPFAPESDEEKAIVAAQATPDSSRVATAASAANPRAATNAAVTIDFDRMSRRVLALPMPVRDYASIVAGPAGTVFIGERIANQPGVTLHRFDVAKRHADVFATGVAAASVSGDGQKLLLQSAGQWSVVGSAAPPPAGSGHLAVSLSAHIDPAEEWKQIFEEAWRLERDFFYDPNVHGADWPAVRRRYEPLIPSVRHREDLNYVLDQVGGELSVGHSFVFGGDLPPTDTSRVGLLGADLVADNGRWRIARILTSESWNPGLRAPLDAPGVKVAAGNYLLAVNGADLTARDDPFRMLDGTADRQTVLRVNDRPGTDGSWTITVVPVRDETGLRQRTWIEDNRRRVDSLSGGKLAYVWVPNTGGGAVTYFDRDFFSQQDREGAVIDERFNQGGNLDDYMVDLMGRHMIGGITNEAIGNVPFRLPGGGVLGPKVLLINELAGSGGDYFPWAFHELGIGPLIGTRTWGGLVRSCVPYALVDGGAITSPCNAVFDARSQYPVEGIGVPPDIEVFQDAKSIARGGDPQLERAVREAMQLVATRRERAPATPPFPVKARRPAP